MQNWNQKLKESTMPLIDAVLHSISVLGVDGTLESPVHVVVFLAGHTSASHPEPVHLPPMFFRTLVRHSPDCPIELIGDFGEDLPHHPLLPETPGFLSKTRTIHYRQVREKLHLLGLLGWHNRTYLPEFDFGRRRCDGTPILLP